MVLGSFNNYTRLALNNQFKPLVSLSLLKKISIYFYNQFFYNKEENVSVAERSIVEASKTSGREISPSWVRIPSEAPFLPVA